ncbi:MAG: DUF481 domain-containing protein [Ignavibacteriales bacterium]|nr:DUF481 domain-containing protein [Ignavibacteriales bacterium]
MKKYLITGLIIICSSLNFLIAQTASEKMPSPQWWLNSSLTDSVDQYLFHVEGQYSYTKMTGALKNEMHSGSVRLIVRKNIFTNHTDYMIDKMNLMIENLGMSYATESQVFTDYLDVDITSLLFGEAGFIWERDNTLYLENRYSLYAGIGLNGLIYEKHYLKILVAAGRVNQEYTIPVEAYNVAKGAHTEFYIRQNYKYVIDQRFSFMEQAYYLTNMTDSKRYRMGVGLNFSIGIIQPVSFVLGYLYKFDKESELLGITAENTTQTIGINISL